MKLLWIILYLYDLTHMKTTSIKLESFFYGKRIFGGITNFWISQNKKIDVFNLLIPVKFHRLKTNNRQVFMSTKQALSTEDSYSTMSGASRGSGCLLGMCCLKKVIPKNLKCFVAWCFLENYHFTYLFYLNFLYSKNLDIQFNTLFLESHSHI